MVSMGSHDALDADIIDNKEDFTLSTNGCGNLAYECSTAHGFEVIKLN